jgi:hypothetical protein
MYVPPVDLYGPIHKALRWAFCRVLSRMGSTSLSDDAEVTAVLCEVQDLVVGLESHIAHEERFIHPAIEERRPGGVAAIMEEHLEHANMMGAIRVLIGAIRTGSPSTRPALWRALYLCFADLLAENIHHMAEEEEVIQPLLEELYSTDELHELHDRLVSSIPAEEMIASMKILLPANDIDFRLAVLNGAKHSLPPEVFAGVFARATVYLSPVEVEALAVRLVRVAA